MSEKRKVAVAMSGGVDSSLSALLLKKEGYEVLGVSFLLFDGQERALEHARRIAKNLEIPHLTIDLRKTFKEKIIDAFLKGYSQGKTPNPCALCNRSIKFGRVAELVRGEFGAEFYATGHYVRKGEYKGFTLFRVSRNLSKDQSYFLALVKREVIERLLFPVGDFESKEKVRELAEAEGLKGFQTSESQDVCFFMGKTLKEVLREHLGEREGEILYQGRVVGRHRGVHFYTIGQRKGLNLPLGRPVYVVKLEAERNRVYLGEEKELEREEFYLEDLNFQLSIDFWEKPMAQIRYRTEKIPVKDLVRVGYAWKVILERSAKRITPGQVCAFYEGEYLLGGGIISN
jgi:tRNA-specific 2-thiouridylase